MMFGVSGSIIPFANHNAAPRNVFSCAMVKQGIGLNTINYQNRYYNTVHKLYYPQMAIAITKPQKYTNFLN